MCVTCSRDNKNHILYLFIDSATHVICHQHLLALFAQQQLTRSFNDGSYEGNEIYEISQHRHDGDRCLFVGCGDHWLEEQGREGGHGGLHGRLRGSAEEERDF